MPKIRIRSVRLGWKSNNPRYAIATNRWQQWRDLAVPSYALHVDALTDRGVPFHIW